MSSNNGVRLATASGGHSLTIAPPPTQQQQQPLHGQIIKSNMKSSNKTSNNTGKRNHEDALNEYTQSARSHEGCEQRDESSNCLFAARLHPVQPPMLMCPFTFRSELQPDAEVLEHLLFFKFGLALGVGVHEVFFVPYMWERGSSAPTNSKADTSLCPCG